MPNSLILTQIYFKHLYYSTLLNTVNTRLTKNGNNKRAGFIGN
jgi:hypothetical protein